MMMRSIFALATAFGLTLAQNASEPAPFNLILQSEDSTLDGLQLGACHAGAAVEALCVHANLTDPMFLTFFFNESAPQSDDPAFLPSGLLTWTFTGGTPVFTQNTAVTFMINPASNLAFPLVWPATDVAQQFSFADGDLLAVQANIDDTLNPPEPFDNYVTYITDRFAVCKTYWQGYGYTALQYVLGVEKPQNPSCQAVTVKRVFL
ncbi:hypothetical protein GGR52DRAFT_213411 [Hypoxylon sp. FL1284]|nr:hypothetical protein GGR52DRAFT_213411 [Hypoxylon sp. FL1284]